MALLSAIWNSLIFLVLNRRMGSDLTVMLLLIQLPRNHRLSSPYSAIELEIFYVQTSKYLFRENITAFSIIKSIHNKVPVIGALLQVTQTRYKRTLHLN